MSGERQITIKIVGDASAAKKAFGDAGAGVDEFTGKIDSSSGKLGNFATIAGGIVAAGAVSKIGGFLKDAAQAAADDAASTERLKVAVENSGVSYDKYADQIDAAIKKGQDLAFSDDDTRAALTALTQETGSTEEALKRLSVAQDLSRGTGMSLEQAAKLLGKTSDENTNTLKKYGITVADGATAQDLMNEVDKRFGGQAAAFAESGAGQWAKLQDKLGEVQEAIGYLVLPAMLALVGVVSQVVDTLSPLIDLISAHIQPVMIGLATAVTVIIIPAFVAWALAAGAAAVATVAAMLPVIAIAAAVGVAVAGLYLIWSTNFLGIRDITQQVIDFIGPYITDAINALQALFEAVWPVISAIVTTAMGVILDIITTDVAAIQDLWNTVWPVLQVVVEGVMLAIQTAVQVGMFAVKDIIGPILGAIADLFTTIWGGIQTTVDTIAGPAGTILGAVNSGMGAVKDAVSSVLGQIQVVWDSIWGAMKGTVTDIIDTVTGAWNSVVGVLNSGLSAWNALSLSFDTHIPGIGTINWNSPDVPLLPYIGGGGGGGDGGVGGKSAQDPPGAGTPGMLPGMPPASVVNSGGGHTGSRPGVPADRPDHVKSPESTTDAPYNPLSGTGNLGGAGQLGHGGGLGKSGGGIITKQQAADVATLVDAGVHPADALTAVTTPTRTPGDPYSQVGAGYTGGYQAGLEGHDSGHVAYSSVTSTYLNPRTGLHQFSGVPESAGSGVFLDGFLVGKFLGWRTRRDAHSLRDPAGCVN